MKITNLLTKTALVAVCLSTAAIASAQGKLVSEIMKGEFKVPRMTRGTVQRFVFPRQTTLKIQAGIAQGQLQRQVSEAALQHTPLPTTILLGHTPQEISSSLHVLVASIPLEKEILAINKAEQDFYLPEVTAAQNLHHSLAGIQQLGTEDIVTIATTILSDIKNHTLQTYLLQSLAKRDLSMLDMDLTEYFGLGKPFEMAAFNYTLRHPHQQILWMRRLLNNPLVDEAAKASVRAFLNKSHIAPEDFPAFQEAISNVWRQYRERLQAAQEADIIQTQVSYYTQLIARLENFIARHNGHRPEWNTADPEAIQLFDEIEWVQQHEDYNAFEPFSSYHNRLNDLWENAAPTYLTPEETIALFDEFVKKTGRLYPHSLRNEPIPDAIPFQRENELRENLDHWRIEGTLTIEDISKIYKKYL